VQTHEGTNLGGFDPTDPAVIEDPYPFYARYRAIAPVQEGVSPDPRFDRAWFVFGFAAANELLRDRTLKSDPRPFLADGVEDNDPPRLSITDPPDHTRQRQVLTDLFRKSAVQGYRAQIRQMAERLFGELREVERPDLVRGYAFKIPIGTIAALLGLPDSDHASMRDWSEDMMKAFDLGGDLETFQASERAIEKFNEYFRLRVAERLRATDLVEHSLLDRLVAASRSGQISGDEVLAMARFLVIAGFETTMNLIGTGYYELARRPDQLAVVAEDPDGTLAGTVQELLRHISPVQRLMARFSDRDVTISDVTIPAGDPIYIMVGAANRDPAEYQNPDEIHVRRDASRHLAFGFGRHICVGALLARIEAEEALRVLIRCRDLFELDDGEGVLWRRMALTRGLETLPIHWKDAL